jgi:beta-lactamase class A
MVAALLLLLAATPPGTTSDFAKSIAAIEAKIGSRIGVVALDTGSGKRLDHRSEERFPMCSTFKLLAVAAILKSVDQEKKIWSGSYVMTKKTFLSMRLSRKRTSMTAA